MNIIGRVTELTLSKAQALYDRYRGRDDGEAVRAIYAITKQAERNQAAWGRLHCLSMYDLGSYLNENGRSRGRPKMWDPHNYRPTLADLGIRDRHVATDARRVAQIPKKAFDAYLAEEQVPTVAGLLRYAAWQHRITGSEGKSQAVDIDSTTSSMFDFADVTGTVHQGDCLEVMQQIPDGSVSGVVTSPPYNLRQSTGGGMHNGNGGKWENAALLNGYDEYEDEMPDEQYIEWQRRCLTEMMRVIDSVRGVIFYNHKWRVQDGLLQDRAEIVAGFPVRQIIIWKRSGGINFNPGYFLPTYEVIYLIANSGFMLSEPGHGYSDVWEIAQERNNSHPAPFPLELARRCIVSIPGKGLILDPFIGSGTTAIAADALGRKWIGIEKSNEYCKVARERIQSFRMERADSCETAAS